MRICLLFFGLLFSGLNEISAQTPTENKIRQAELRKREMEDSAAAVSEDLEALKLQRIRETLQNWVLPERNAGEEVIMHSAMALVYSEAHEQARWVAHLITTDVADGRIGRSNDFRPDPKISTGSAVEADYFIRYKQAGGKDKYEGFGYDRGHLAPSADFRWSAKALSESFYYSNMSPQLPDFNRISWARLEDMLRSYADNRNAELAVVTGPVLTNDLPKVEKAINKPSIPAFYFKIALDKNNNRAIGFIMPNRKCEYPVEHYAVSIDSVERLTGINFFPNLSDALEDSLEALRQVKDWLGIKEQMDADPLDPTRLPRNHFNTVQAKLYMGQNERISVCGKVVSTKLSAKGNVFLNLDKAFPNQIFTVTIFKDRMGNFTYRPEEVLMGKTICVEGKVTDFNGTPSMVLENEKAVRVMVE
jgi:endonuclease G